VVGFELGPTLIDCEGMPEIADFDVRRGERQFAGYEAHRFDRVPANLLSAEWRCNGLGRLPDANEFDFNVYAERGFERV
jgi:hypothetical protein